MSTPARAVLFAFVLAITSSCGGSGDPSATSGTEPDGATTDQGQTDTDTDGQQPDESGQPGAGTEPDTQGPGEGEPTENPYATVGPADTTLEPIEIGYMSLSFIPETQTGFTAGVNWVNEDLGGVAGHPLEVSYCATDFTPESSISCANRFVEEGVTAVAIGLDLTADAAVNILGEAGIVSLVSADLVASLRPRNDNAFIQIAPTEEVMLADAILVAEEWQVDTVAFIGGVDEASQLNYERFVEASGLLGVEVVGGMIAGDVGAAPDFAAMAATVVASGAQGVVIPIADEFSCLELINGLNTFGFTGPILAAGCLNFPNIVPDVSVGVYGNHPWIPYGTKGVDGQVVGDFQAMERKLTDLGQANLLGTYAEVGFQHAPWVADVMSQASDPTDAASVKEAAATASGPRRPFGATPWACDDSGNPGLSACGTGVVHTRIDENLDRVIVGQVPVDVSELAGLID